MDPEFIITQVVAKHTAWYPLYNRGLQAPPAARQSWAETLRPFPPRTLIALIGDTAARNRVLGRHWPKTESGFPETGS